jgi:hypothetical protein
MQNLQQDRADVEAAQRSAREANAWLQFITQHREVQNCESNRQLASEYHNGSEMTLDSLLDSFNSPAFRALLALRNSTPAEDRAASLETIKKITGIGETPLTKWQTNEQLAKKATELEERREFSKKSRAELRQIVKQNSPVVAEDDLPASMTREYLLGLSAPGAFKKVVERYGSAAVTRRLNQR